MRVHALLACPACGSGDAAPFEIGAYALRRCRACDHVYAADYADPDEVYVDGYLTGGTDFGIDVRDSNFQRWLAFVANRRMALIERRVPRPATLLDVGCGTGEVLLAARSRGWTVTGVEPVVESARFATEVRHLDVRCTTLEASGLSEHTFDVVSAIHVVEHMPDAQSFVRTIARWARPGGLVVLEVPNWRSMNRRSMGGAWLHLRPLEHLSHFSPATLGATMAQAGLTEIDVTTPSLLWNEQSFDETLADLGLAPYRGLLPLQRQATRFGHPEVMPTRLGSALFRSTAAVYGVAHVGNVIAAYGRAS